MVDDDSSDELKPSEDSDQVGYKRPPKAHRFKKGCSGNPCGRRKGSKSFQTLVREAFTRRIPMKLGGKLTTVSAGQALLIRTLQDGLGGNRRAVEQGLRLMERYCLLEEDEEEIWDLKLLDDEEFEVFERLLCKVTVQENECRAEQDQPAPRAIRDPFSALDNQSESHETDDQ